MSRLTRRVIATTMALGLAMTACSNSSGGGNSSAEGSGSTVTTAADGGASQRDEFVEISGVPGVTDDEIGYAVVGTKAGNPLGTCILDCYVDGIEAYFAYRNSEGGIYGRELVVADVLDDELGANQARSLDVVSSDDYFGNFQATLLPTGWVDLDAAGVPSYVWGIHATELPGRPAIIPSLPIRCPGCSRPIVTYAASAVGATKVASIGYGDSQNSKDCTNGTAAGVESYAADTGVEVVYVKDDLVYGLANGIGPEVTAMKNAGVEFITTCMDRNGMKTLATELVRQGMSDVTLFHPNSYDQAFIAENAELFEGDFVDVQFRPLEAEAGGSSLTEFEEWMAETGAEPTELAMVGWINASMAFDGLLAAGPEFDRESVLAANNSFTEYTVGGLTVPVNWPDAHTPYTVDDPPPPDEPDCSAVVRVQDGELVTVADPATPWLCWEPLAEGYTEPTETNFE